MECIVHGVAESDTAEQLSLSWERELCRRIVNDCVRIHKCTFNHWCLQSLVHLRKMWTFHQPSLYRTWRRTLGPNCVGPSPDFRVHQVTDLGQSSPALTTSRAKSFSLLYKITIKESSMLASFLVRIKLVNLLEYLMSLFFTLCVNDQWTGFDILFFFQLIFWKQRLYFPVLLQIHLRS